MTYAELLNDDRWTEKRSRILSRDKYECSHCRNRSIEETADICSFTELFFNRQLINIIRDEMVEVDNYGIRLNHPNVGIIECWFNRTVWIKTPPPLWGRSLLTEDSKFYVERHEDPETGANSYWIALIAVADPNGRHQYGYVRNLHVHHTYYQEGRDPWDYPDEALKTFCWKCHEDFHREYQVPRLNSEGVEIGMLTSCFRCHGAGWFPQYKHVEQGICFRCSGARYEEFFRRV